MLFGFISGLSIFSIGGAALFMVLGGLLLGGEGLQYKTGINTSEYLVYGKSSVKSSVCNFVGKITIIKILWIKFKTLHLILYLLLLIHKK
jgi:hypothetical protein